MSKARYIGSDERFAMISASWIRELGRHGKKNVSSLAAAIAAHANHATGECRVSRERLAEESGICDERAVSRAAADLVEMGYMEKVKTRGASIYKLLPHPSAQSAVRLTPTNVIQLRKKQDSSVGRKAA